MKVSTSLNAIDTALKHMIDSKQVIGVSALTDRVDIANARLVFPGGCVANVTASRISAQKVRKLRVIWYQIDESDADVATFFYYLGKAAPRRRRPLALLTAEYQQQLRACLRGQRIFRGSIPLGVDNLASLDARVDPTNDQGRIGTTLQRSIPFGSRFSARTLSISFRYCAERTSDCWMSGLSCLR